MGLLLVGCRAGEEQRGERRDGASEGDGGGGAGQGLVPGGDGVLEPWAPATQMRRSEGRRKKSLIKSFSERFTQFVVYCRVL